MIIPEQLRKNVGFVFFNHKDGTTRLAGTCFWLFMLHKETGGGWQYTITAKHVILGIREKSADSVVRIRVNLKAGGSEMLESHVDDWFSLEDDDPTDVAVLDFSPGFGGKYDAVHIQDDMAQDFSELPFLEKAWQRRRCCYYWSLFPTCWKGAQHPYRQDRLNSSDARRTGIN